MDLSPKAPEDDTSDVDSLETPSTVVEYSNGESTQPENSDTTGPINSEASPDTSATVVKEYKDGKGFWQRINIYLLLFILLMVLAVVIVSVSYLYNSKSNQRAKTLKQQSLSQDSLNQLANSAVTVGDSKQVLNIQSNAVFTGKVLVRDTLEVANGLKVGGNMSLNGIKVSGNSVLDDLQVSKNLAVTGNVSVQGDLQLQKSLNVNGGGKFNGNVSANQITTSSLQLLGDLTMTRHILTGGATPGRSNGSALGGGGSSSVSGSDTSGSIAINTGSSPGVGCFITINFVTKFNNTPHVIVTPVGSAAAGLGYYINRSATNFSVCSINPAPAAQSFGFDYMVLG